MRLLCGLCIAAGCGRVDFAVVRDGAPQLDGAPMPDAGDCPAFALFCDDFESGNLAKWDGQLIAASQIVNATAAHAGNFGLDSSVPTGMGAGAAGDTFVAVSGFSTTLAVREFVYSPAPLLNYVGTLFFYQGDQTTTTTYTEIDPNDVAQWEFSEFEAALKDHAGSTVTQQAIWTCVEMDVDFTGAGTGSLYVDDQLVVSTAYVEGMPSYDGVAVGVTRANAGGFELYIDDVVIATQHIGC